MEIEAVVVGAGLSGCAAARVLADAGFKVLIIEKRPYVGGLCKDGFNSHGVFIHFYGPHIFHTRSEKAWQFACRFTSFLPYIHRVFAAVDGKFVPLPPSLATLQKLLPQNLYAEASSKLIEQFGVGAEVDLMELCKSKDKTLSVVSSLLWDKIYAPYNKKMWEIDAKDVGSKVRGRLKFKVSLEENYFRDPYQGIPVDGYSTLCYRMIDHPNIRLLLQTEASSALRFRQKSLDVMGHRFNGPVIITSPLDELFSFCYGHLPFRSINIEWRVVPSASCILPAPIVNYPQHLSGPIRETEYRQMTGQMHCVTAISREYPVACHDRDATPPAYPVPDKAAEKLYSRYKSILQRYAGVFVAGRLGLYRYMNMDEALLSGMEAAQAAINWRRSYGRRPVS